MIVEVKTKPAPVDTSVKPNNEEKIPVNKKVIEETSNEDDDPTKDVMSKDKAASTTCLKIKMTRVSFLRNGALEKKGQVKPSNITILKKEAIEVAEDLAEKAGTSIVIHKMDGKIRKQDYTK